MKDRVICITSDWDDVTGLKVEHPVKDRIYTVVETNEQGGQHFYTLAEFQPHLIFETSGFRPVKPIDLWLEDEQAAYLEALEILMPGVEVVRGGYRALK